MSLTIGGIKLPNIKLPKIDLGSISQKGLDLLKNVAKDMFRPSADGQTLFNPEINVRIGQNDLRLRNPVEALAQKLLGGLSSKLRDLGYNPDVIANAIGGQRNVAGVQGPVEMPRLPERVAAYTAVGGGTASNSSTKTSASATAGGTDFASAALDKLGGSISGLDGQINTLMGKGDNMSMSDQLKLQQLMQRRSELFQLLSQIMNMEHETKRQIISNIR